MNKKLLTTFSAMAAFGLFAGGSLVNAQDDIEFMGKNGEKVELRPQVEGIPGDRPIQAAPPRLPRRGLGLGNFNLRGRTFTVTGPDGEQKEISTDDARSIVVNRSFTSVNQNGEQQIKQGGTAIIVAADGQRYEIDLGELGDADLKGETVEAKPIEVKKSYMVGVFCEPVPEMMRSQMNLDEGVGLIVQRVQAGSPAAEAGVEKYDILMYADDQLLSTVEDLTSVVTEAGSQEQSFTLTLMRGGEELPVDVTPSEREMAAGMMGGRMPMGGFEMNDMGPGLIFGKEFDGDMMKRMQDHMQEVRDQMKRMDNLLQNQQIPLPQLPMHAIPKDAVR